MLELLNQLDGFSSDNKIKVRGEGKKGWEIRSKHMASSCITRCLAF